jgi:hypothetical protein
MSSQIRRAARWFYHAYICTVTISIHHIECVRIRFNPRDNFGNRIAPYRSISYMSDVFMSAIGMGKINACDLAISHCMSSL